MVWSARFKEEAAERVEGGVVGVQPVVASANAVGCGHRAKRCHALKLAKGLSNGWQGAFRPAESTATNHEQRPGEDLVVVNVGRVLLVGAF